MRTPLNAPVGLPAGIALLALSVLLGVVVYPGDAARHTTEAPLAAVIPPLDELIGMEGVAMQPLARGSFADHIDATVQVNLAGGTATTAAEMQQIADVMSAHLTFEADGFVGWHTHPGPGIVTIVSGALTIVNEIDCVAREYGPGQAFVDVGQGNVHVAYNASGGETEVHAVFLDVPPGEGPTILLEEPGVCPS